MSEHLDLDALAAAADAPAATGSATATDTATGTATGAPTEHVADCPVCRTRLAHLRELLAQLPHAPDGWAAAEPSGATTVMPPAVAARVRAALAATARPENDTDHDELAAARTRRTLATRRGTSRRSVLVAAAAIAVVTGLGALGVRLAGVGTNGGAASTADSGATGAPTASAGPTVPALSRVAFATDVRALMAARSPASAGSGGPQSIAPQRQRSAPRTRSTGGAAELRCARRAVALTPTGGNARSYGSVTVDGRPGLLYVVTDRRGTRTAVALADCSSADPVLLDSVAL